MLLIKNFIVVYYSHMLNSVTTELLLEPNRYWLFTSKSCPYAHRVEIVLKLKSLEPYVRLHWCNPVFKFTGWELDYDYVQNIPNDFTGKLETIYKKADPEYNGKYYSLPLLYDSVENKIISNESADIIKIFNSMDTNSLDLYPEDFRDAIDAFCKQFNQRIGTDTYRAGHSKTQEEYKQLYNLVFEYLDILDKILDGKYIFGDRLTLADVYTYAHLIRFDCIFRQLFSLNKAHLWEYPNIYSYMVRLSHDFNFGSTVDMLEMMKGAFMSENNLPANMGCMKSMILV